MDENEKYVPENPALEPELREVPEVPEFVEENVEPIPLDPPVAEPVVLPPVDPMLGPVSGVVPEASHEAVMKRIVEEPFPEEVHREETYVREEPERVKRGPTAEEIRDYRLNQPRPSKYNQPRSDIDPARQSPNTRASMAIAGFILGLLGLLLFWIPYVGFVLPVLAVLFGAIGLVQSQSQPGQYGGRGFAIAGIVLGLIGLGLAFLTLSILGCVVDWFRAAFQFR